MSRAYDQGVARTAEREPTARKALGQHFLRDSGVLRDIGAAVRPPPGGMVLEIGPGTGALTAELLDRGFEVVALEIEDRMVSHLTRRFPSEPRLHLALGDARDMDTRMLMPPGRPFVVAGNLPYFAANPIVRRLLESERQPVEMVVMVQREVAREMCGLAGGLSLLGISVQVYAEPQLLFDVRPEAFDPPPAVTSSVIRLTVRQEPLVPRPRLPAFFELVSRTFRNPRKQIHNGLARAVWLPPEGADAALRLAGIDPTRRAETLPVAEWLGLLDAVESVRAHA